MKELFKQWLSKITCHHKWFTHYKNSVYEDSNSARPYKIEETLICENCGKIKKNKPIKMKDELISYETAVLAKEKGFDGECEEFYIFPEGILNDDGNFIDKVNHNEFPDVVSAPNQSLLQRWLREKHEILLQVVTPYFNSNNFQFQMPVEIKWINSDYFETYESALEKGLQEGLKLIENGN